MTSGDVVPGVERRDGGRAPIAEGVAQPAHRRRASHRCSLLGILPIGVTGPSIMGGTADRDLRTNCFAATPDPAASLRNRTRIAEYLHGRLE